MNCRHCATPLSNKILDLGYSPPSNAYRSAADSQLPEVTYPLRIHVCTNCWLVQTEDYATADSLFTADYAYFSSTSSIWLAHAKTYCEQMQRQFALGKQSFVVEIASNDGYLLKNFVSAGIPCLGIEPTASTAEAARRAGVESLEVFFGVKTAAELVIQGKQADLLLGNNVYAHVPDINDFTEGLALLLKPEGVITLEFPHVLNLLSLNQFDTVYHEHYSYLSLTAVKRIFEQFGLRIWHVECLATHGGSLRIYGCHSGASKYVTQSSVPDILGQEERAGLLGVAGYQRLQAGADAVKHETLSFLLDQHRQGKRIAAYGAAAKGNTLMNYAGIRADLVEFVSDAAVSKQGKRMPGSQLPILPPKAIAERRPDLVWILPWNIADEVAEQQSVIRSWGGQFVTSLPKLRVF